MIVTLHNMTHPRPLLIEGRFDKKATHPLPLLLGGRLSTDKAYRRLLKSPLKRGDKGVCKKGVL